MALMRRPTTRRCDSESMFRNLQRFRQPLFRFGSHRQGFQMVCNYLVYLPCWRCRQTSKWPDLRQLFINLGTGPQVKITLHVHYFFNGTKVFFSCLPVGNKKNFQRRKSSPDYIQRRIVRFKTFDSSFKMFLKLSP